MLLSILESNSSEERADALSKARDCRISWHLCHNDSNSEELMSLLNCGYPRDIIIIKPAVHISATFS